MNFALDYSTELEVFNIFMITETKGRNDAVFKVIQHTDTLTCTEHIMFYHIMFQNSINLTWIEGHLGLKDANKQNRSFRLHKNLWIKKLLVIC